MGGVIEHTVSTDRGRVAVASAWTMSETDAGISALLDHFADVLPVDLDANIVVKPNLNNDLAALTGNCTDLRVLAALIEALAARGYRRLTIADGSNVGVERRNIRSFQRLRVDKLAERLGVRLVDLNGDSGTRVTLHGGATPKVASTVTEADFLINVPTVKTHVEAGLSCAMKNWVGITVGQDKRHMHYDLCRNIAALNEHVKPDLVIVDGLVGMEGNGPGDGDPFRLGTLVASDHAPLCDVAICRLIDLPIEKVPYLGHAMEVGLLDEGDVHGVFDVLPIKRTITPAPARSVLAELSEARSLMWLKKAVRPLTDRPVVSEAAYRLGVIQDVYSMEDDAVTRVVRADVDCGECARCADVCPTRLSVEEIGVKTDLPECIGCLYCWWVCPDSVITVEGPLNHMERQVDRYKTVVEGL